VWFTPSDQQDTIFLLDFLFFPEDGNDVSPGNIGLFAKYAALQQRRQRS
jgi:hypothetical protein